LMLLLTPVLAAPSTNSDPTMTPHWWGVLAALFAGTVLVQGGAVALARRGRLRLALVLSLLFGWVIVVLGAGVMAVGITFLTLGIALIAQQIGRVPTWVLIAQVCVLVAGLGVLRHETVAEIAGTGQPAAWEGMLLGYLLVAGATIITWRVWAEEQRLSRLAVELRLSRSRLVEATDSARRSLERDLHDGAQQRIVTASLNVATARRLVTTRPDRADAMLAATSLDLQQAAAQLRDISHGIYPAELARGGLDVALGTLAAHSPRPVTVEFHDLDRQDPDVEAAAYFCCAEAVQNATTHAGPDAHVRIRIEREATALSVTITDDGTGFDPATVNAGQGLTNIHDRIAAIGGDLAIHTSPTTGTTIHATIPLVTDASWVPRPDLDGLRGVLRRAGTVSTA
jgi:signal transduction histidine kinase